jgi:hypothetical protein
MTRKFVMFAAALAAVAFVAQGVQAQEYRNLDRRIKAVEVGVGAASTAAFFAMNNWNWKWDSGRSGVTALGAWGLTTMGCAALSPIVATAVIQRPLTYREAHIMIADCLIPIVGGWLVNEAYNQHILWAPDEPQAAAPLAQAPVAQEPVVVKHKKKRQAKM